MDNVIISANVYKFTPAMQQTSRGVVNPERRIGMFILTQKKCTKCGVEKSINDFYKDQYRCKECQKEEYRIRYKKNPEKLKQQGRQSYYRHIEKRKSYSVNYRLENPEKEKIRHRRYHEKNKEKERSANLQRSYGISLEKYNEIYNKQNGKCLLCGKHKNVLQVDHSHTDGKVRGLICGKCNRAIGLIDDSPTLAEKIASYLKGLL